MKKTFILMLLAMLAVCITSCKKSGDTKDVENTVLLKCHFNGNGENFSISYPEILQVGYTDETTFTANAADNDARLDVVLKQDGDFSDLMQFMETFKNQAEFEKFDEPTIDGNVITMKSVNLGEVCRYFVVKKDDQNAVVGKYYYKEAKAADFEKFFEPILKSVEIQ